MTWTAKTIPLTKYTDFRDNEELKIPNLVPTAGVVANPTGDAAIERLNRLITKYEKRLYETLLTKAVYADFAAAMIGSTQPAQKWIDLFDKLTANPIAPNYIYYWYCRDSFTQSTGLGEVRPIMENSTGADAEDKMCRAWNENWKWYLELDEWFNANQDVYLFDRSTDVIGYRYAFGGGSYSYLYSLQPINTYGL